MCPGPNLVRSARAAHTVALDWIAPTFRFQLDGISHIALPKPKSMRGQEYQPLKKLSAHFEAETFSNTNHQPNQPPTTPM